jgi:hypothetical protein
MASRRDWDSLSPAYRERLSRSGITKTLYERGTNLSTARGHRKTPEHGLKSARKNPGRYPEYIRSREVPQVQPASGSAENEAYELNAARDAAFLNFHSRLHDYYKYNRKIVLANVYGGETAESGTVRGMNLAEARWTANAGTEELRVRAYPQYHANPWWYH